jgi:di/tricarboxylate transporter
MNAMTDANSLFSQPVSLFTILAFIVLGWLLRAMPKPTPAPATIALGSPRLVALSPEEAAAARRLFGSVAADLMAELEHWQ